MSDWKMAGSERAVNSEGNEADVEDLEEEGNQGYYVVSKNAVVAPKLNNEVDDDTNVPKSKKRLIKALKKLQLECTLLEAEFYREVHHLECKYAELYAPLYGKRKEIIKGLLEPSDEECYFPSDVDTEDELSEDMYAKLDISQQTVTDTLTGIPGFWLTALKSVDMIAEMIQPHDEPILQYLSDIKVTLFESNPMGFCLEFYFEPNDFFTNSVLVKTYEMKCVVEELDPFGFDGPEIHKCEGCKIDWKPGKDVTVKTVTKKQKHKNSGSVRLVTKTVMTDSFFNFFNPPTINQDSSSQDEDDVILDLLSADFEIGHFIRERFVPRAVLFFTGEAVDMEDLECEAEEEGNEEDEEQD